MRTEKHLDPLDFEEKLLLPEAQDFFNERTEGFEEEEKNKQFKILLECITKENVRRVTEEQPLLSVQEEKYLIQYGVRTIEKFKPEGLRLQYINPLEGTIKGHHDERSVFIACEFAKQMFRNLDEEIDKLVEEQGEVLKNILDSGEKMIFVCTHPSWNTLPLPTLLLQKIQKNYVESDKTRILLAPAPTMPIKKISGHGFNVKELLKGLGLDILVTTPDNPDREKDADVRELGEKSRSIAARKLLEFSNEKDTSLLIAPEGTTTPVDENGKYKLKTVSKGTVSSLHMLGVQRNRTEDERKHFILFGMAEENRQRKEIEPTKIQINMEILSPEQLAELDNEGNNEKSAFVEKVMVKLAELVDGTYEGLPTTTSQEHSSQELY